MAYVLRYYLKNSIPSFKSSYPLARNRVTVAIASLVGVGGRRHWLLPNISIMEGEMLLRFEFDGFIGSGSKGCSVVNYFTCDCANAAKYNANHI